MYYVRKTEKMGVNKYVEKLFSSAEDMLLFLQENPLYVLHWKNDTWALDKMFFNERKNINNSKLS